MNKMEAFMFASVNAKNGTLLGSKSTLTYGLAGIALYELTSMGRLSFDGKNIALISYMHTGSVFLDDSLDIIAKKQKSYKTRILTTRLAYGVKRFARRALESLEDNGFIRIEQNRFLGLIPYKRYIVTRLKEQSKLVNEIREIIQRDNKRPEPQQAFFISLLSACNVLGRLFDRNERKQFNNTLKKIRRADYFETLDEFGGEVTKAVKSAIAAAQAAAG